MFCTYLLPGSLRSGGVKLLARALVVAAQHVGIALVVQDLGGRPDDADGLSVSAIGEIEATQAVVGGRKPEPQLPRRADAVRPRGGNISRRARNYWRGIASCRGSRRRSDRCHSRPASAAAGTPSGGGGCSAAAPSVAGAAAYASVPGVFASKGLVNLPALQPASQRPRATRYNIRTIPLRMTRPEGTARGRDQG